MNKLDKDMTRAWAEIDLEAIRHNYMAARSFAARHGSGVIAVVKADAYGHGAVPIALELQNVCGADRFAVATLPEALELCEAGITARILILSEVHKSLHEELVRHPNIRPCVFRTENARSLSEAAVKAGVTVGCHIAVDTGMSRIGFECLTDEKQASSLDAISQIAALPGITCEGIFSHLACADEADKSSALAQAAKFDEFIAHLEAHGIRIPQKSLCNSAALTEEAFQNKYDYVRAGIVLYGLPPSDEVANVLGVRPAMSLKARITDVKTLGPGIGISYGHTFITERETRVATLPVGYADGYPRLLSGKASVLIGGRPAPILGRVCMDQMMVDVTDIPDAAVGGVAVLIGGEEEIRADYLGAAMGTIGYELLCAVSPRIPRVYRGSML